MYRNRYRRIVWFFAQVLISVIWWDLILPRIGLRGLAKRTRPERLRRAAAAFRLLAVQMGGVMIKVGQFFSARVDVLPTEIINELSGLQDEVPPERFSDIRRVAEGEFGQPLEQKYFTFEEQPLAAASLGQVHRAQIRLEDGDGTIQDVVVKIQRPDIETIIKTDMAALYTVGDWLRRYRPISRRADVPALLEQFSRILYEEIDYLAEGRNAETFATNFKDEPSVRVPSVIWTHTTRRALTLENVLAIKITDYDAITAAGIDRSEVASRLLDTYLQQIFEDGFFHADPHPGNLFVQPLPSGTTAEPGKTPWQLTFVDFGMVGRVPANLRDGLREMLIGVGTQDAARVIRSYKMLDVLLPGADLALIEKAEAKLFDRFWGKSMSELRDTDPREIAQFAHEFRQLIYSLPFQVPHDLIFLARAVAILSGMCTGLDPDFNLWDHLAPYAQQLISKDGKGASDQITNELLDLARILVALPKKMDHVLDQINRGETILRTPELNHQVNRLVRALQQVSGGLVFTAFLVGGVQLYLSNHQELAALLLSGAAVSLFWTIFFARPRD